MPGMTDRNIRGVNLNLLLAFDALMAERNVTRAARHNGLSQPAMSKALNRLRHLLDDRLFELRDGRRACAQRLAAESTPSGSKRSPAQRGTPSRSQFLATPRRDDRRSSNGRERNSSS